MEGDVKFEGPAPFFLPVAQSTAAVPHHNNGVTVIFSCLLPGARERADADEDGAHVGRAADAGCGRKRTPR